jgi:hypothetical protein
MPFDGDGLAFDQAETRKSLAKSLGVDLDWLTVHQHTDTRGLGCGLSERSRSGEQAEHQ